MPVLEDLATVGRKDERQRTERAREQRETSQGTRVRGE